MPSQHRQGFSWPKHHDIARRNKRIRCGELSGVGLMDEERLTQDDMREGWEENKKKGCCMIVIEWTKKRGGGAEEDIDTGRQTE